jgi:hypothetical protein
LFLRLPDQLLGSFLGCDPLQGITSGLFHQFLSLLFRFLYQIMEEARNKADKI